MLLTTKVLIQLSLVPLTTEKLFLARSENDFCCIINARRNKGEMKSFILSENRLQFHSVESFSKIFIPHSLIRFVQQLSHHTKMAWHSWERRLYLFLCIKFLRQNLQADSHAVTLTWMSFELNRERLLRSRNTLQLFPATRPFEYVTQLWWDSLRRKINS